MNIKKLRIHLSTLVIMMLFASGLLWLNSREISNPAHQEFIAKKDSDPMLMPARCFRGWPWHFEWNWEKNPRAELEAMTVRDMRFIALNALFGMFVLAIAAVVSEKAVLRAASQGPVTPKEEEKEQDK